MPPAAWKPPVEASPPPPSATRVRAIAEWVLRAVALLLLAWLVVASLGAGPAPSAARADSASLDDALREWTARAPEAAWVSLDALPHAESRAWLGALRRAGTPVAWGGDSLPALALETSPIADPVGGSRVRVAAGRGARVALWDAAGLVDTVAVRGAGSSVSFGATAGAVEARTARGTARVAPMDSLRLGRLLVLARAGWEAKFVIAALEERGWSVDARLRVAPGVDVTQGTPASPDTARYAAVIALDTTAADRGAAIARFVRQGGGLLLAGDAARIPALASLAPGTAGTRVAGAAGALEAEDPRRGLALWPVTQLRDGAVPLERRGSSVTVAARRLGVGRVVQVGHDDSWRWRMAGGEGAAGEHRAWWSSLVSAVAYAPVVRSPDSSGDAPDPAPRAALLDALGAPTPPPAGETGRSRDPLRATTFAAIVVLLLLEWASRRLRGAR